MLVRLWWKEFRVFGPVGLILLFAAALSLGFLLAGREEDIQHWDLTSVALSWAVLYAFAVAAGAFSGERETKTLGFLDALPVPRATLWLGKASFAVISTALLVLVLSGLAVVVTPANMKPFQSSWISLCVTFGPLLIEGVAWGLLWSAVSKNTLIAAVLAVVSALGVLGPSWDQRARWEFTGRFSWEQGDFWQVVIPLGLATLALGISFLSLTWFPSLGWSIVAPRSFRAARPFGIRNSSTNLSLFWQVANEGWGMGLMVLAFSLFIPITTWLWQERFDGIMDIFLATLASLVAGVSVFGSENAIGSRQFLVHHGVRASSVWWRRLVAWGGLLALILGVAIAALYHSPASLVIPGFSSRPDRALILTTATVNAFAIGILCGWSFVGGSPRRSWERYSGLRWCRLSSP